MNFIGLVTWLGVTGLWKKRYKGSKIISLVSYF